nr:unnamed protein product [Callosobruchus chinensis]
MKDNLSICCYQQTKYTTQNGSIETSQTNLPAKSQEQQVLTEETAMTLEGLENLMKEGLKKITAEESLTHDVTPKCLDESPNCTALMHAFSEQMVISNDILPSNSVNDNTILETGQYRDCVVLEGMFMIEDKLWAVIYKNNKLNPKYYRYVLKRNIINHVNNTCLLNFKYHKYLKKEDRIVIYAACKHNSYRCKKFEIYVKDKVTPKSAVLSSQPLKKKSKVGGETKILINIH